MHATFTAWILRLLLTIQPLATHPEPVMATLSRYQMIASVVAELSIEQPSLGGQFDTARLLLVTSWHESRWRKSVRHGAARGDNGQSWCEMQIRLGRSGTRETPRGYTARSLVGSSRGSMVRCFQSGLDVLAKSRYSCRDLGEHGWLTVYFGKCGRGEDHARRRWGVFSTWRWRFPEPVLPVPATAARCAMRY